MNTLAEKTPQKTDTSPGMKVSWLNQLIAKQEKNEEQQDNKRMTSDEVKIALEKEKNVVDAKPDLDAKVIDFKYEKPDPSQFKNATAYFKAKDNPSKELVNKNFENIKNSSYGGVGKIMQKIEDRGNSPKAQFVDEQNFIDQQIKEGSLKLADPNKNIIFNKNNSLEKKSGIDSILRLGNSMKSITSDGMSGAIIMALDRAKMLEKIQAGHAKGYTYNVLHIPGSPDFTLQEIKNVDGVLQKELKFFYIKSPDTPQKITPVQVGDDQPVAPRILENPNTLEPNSLLEPTNDPLMKFENFPKPIKKVGTTEEKNAYEQYQQDVADLGEKFGDIATVFTPKEPELIAKENNDYSQRENVDFDQSALVTENLPGENGDFNFGGIQVPEQQEDEGLIMQEELVPNKTEIATPSIDTLTSEDPAPEQTAVEILQEAPEEASEQIPEEIKQVLEKIDTHQNSEDVVKEVEKEVAELSPEKLQQEIESLKKSLEEIRAEQKNLLQERVRNYPESRQRTANALMDKFDYALKNPWVMFGYGILAILFVGPAMLAYGSLATGLKQGTPAGEKVMKALENRFGNKQETNPKKLPENKEKKDSIETKKEDPKATVEDEKKSLEEEKKKFLEKMYGGKIEGDTKESWEKLKKTPLNKFLEPEKYPWPQSEGADKDYQVGEITTEKYSPSSKKIHPILVEAYKKVGYKEIPDNIDVEKFIEHAITHKLIEQ
jgi:hypothetical protein